jgi:hypothetical protein
MDQPVGSTAAASAAGNTGGQERPDIGHEAHQAGKHAPQDWARHPDRPEPQSDHDTEARVQRELDQEVARQPARRIIHRDGGSVEVLRAEKPDQAVAQVLPLEKDEDRDDQHDARVASG